MCVNLLVSTFGHLPSAGNLNSRSVLTSGLRFITRNKQQEPFAQYLAGSLSVISISNVCASSEKSADVRDAFFFSPNSNIINNLYACSIKQNTKCVHELRFESTIRTFPARRQMSQRLLNSAATPAALWSGEDLMLAQYFYPAAHSSKESRNMFFLLQLVLIRVF